MRREKSACSLEIMPNLKKSRLLNVPHLQPCHLQVPPARWKLPAAAKLPGCVFLFWQCPEVSHQFRYIVGLDLGAKGRHLSSALGDHFSQLLVGLLLNFGGAQSLRMECLAGWAVAAAIGRVAQDAVRLVDFGGIGL